MRKRMALTVLLPLAAFLSLTGCVTPEQQAAMDAAQKQADTRECESFGFRPGSTAFGNCMLKLKEIRAQEANTQAIERANNRPPPWWGYGPPYWW